MKDFSAGVTIVTEGSYKKGFGRIKRSITLAKMLSNLVPVQIWVISPSPTIDPRIVGFFEGLVVSAGPVQLTTYQVQIVDLESDEMLNYLSNVPEGRKCVCLDWFDASRLPTVTINLFDHSGEMRNAYREIDRELNYMDGADFAIIRPSILRLRPVISQCREVVRQIVISFGGSDPSQRTLAALRDLASISLSSYSIIVIIGPLVPEAYAAQVEDIALSSYQVLWAPKDFEAILASADVVMCGGGTTLLESMYLGKPTVVYPQTNSEQSHALSYVRAGGCVFSDSLIDVLDSCELRNSIAMKASQLVDGQGAERIVREVFRLLG